MAFLTNDPLGRLGTAKCLNLRLVEPLGMGYGSCARQVGTLAGAGKSG